MRNITWRDYARLINAHVRHRLPHSRGPRTIGCYISPFVDELMDIEQRTWATRRRGIPVGTPIGGLGFMGPFMPNYEPAASLTAVTGGSAEVALFASGGAGAGQFSQIPASQLRPAQSLFVFCEGLATSSATTQTCAWTARFGSSATLASNPVLGATGLLSLGASSAQTNMIWSLAARATVRTLALGATGSTVFGNSTRVECGNVAGSAAASAVAIGGNNSVTFDMSVTQGIPLTITPSAAGVSVTVTGYVLLAAD